MRVYLQRAFCLLIMLLPIAALSNSYRVYPYISPGAKIGFGRQGLTFTPKVSTGVNSLFFPRPAFFNVTYGKQLFLTAKARQLKAGYRFLEFEAGILSIEQLSFGGGLGLAIPLKGTFQLMPKFSLFAGYLAFFRTDHVLFKGNLYNDYGLMLVAPFGSIITLWD